MLDSLGQIDLFNIFDSFDDIDIDFLYMTHL